jgi:hypothetical protein
VIPHRTQHGVVNWILNIFGITSILTLYMLTECARALIVSGTLTLR